MSLIESIKPLIRICQLFGLAQFSIDKSTSKWQLSSKLKCWSIVFIIFNGIILLSAFIFNDLFTDYRNYNSSKIRTFLNVLLMSFSHMNALLVLLEAFIKRDQCMEFLETIEYLEIFYKQHLDTQVNYKRLKTSCRRFIILWLSSVVAFIISNTIAYVQTKSTFFIRYLFVIFLSFGLCKLGYIYLQFLILLIVENLNVLKIYVESVTKKNGYYLRENYPKTTKFAKQKKNHFVSNEYELDPKILRHLRITYAKIWTASLQVQNLMYYSLPFGFSNGLFALTFLCYFVFMRLFLGTDNLLAPLPLLIIISIELIAMFSFAFTCNKVTESVSCLSLLFKFFKK